jgi:hypothetical protein
MGYMSLETPDAPAVKKIPVKKEYIIGAVLVVLAIVPSTYFYLQYQKSQSSLLNPNLYALEETKKYVTAIGKLMTLPSDETPTLATVNDKEKLKNQPFFANAENGDKVLIYTNAKKAILFRPSLNKIIDVAPVNIGPVGSESATLVGSAPAVATVKFALRNGTGVVGLTNKFETVLKSKITNAEVTGKDNAKKKDYVKSILIDVKGTKSAQTTQFAGELGLTISTMPPEEATPASDFLVILGTDTQ